MLAYGRVLLRTDFATAGFSLLVVVVLISTLGQLRQFDRPLGRCYDMSELFLRSADILSSCGTARGCCSAILLS
jgi:hypothetical protein